ncbi:MAG: class I SAM-dependent methyltransferase [Cyclobacteriaceae bacterium]|jgi:SAM-dependent methyltransferase|nr:class I SAM-dependent methyltransferase [Cyclobacteriaceae bacterium]
MSEIEKFSQFYQHHLQQHGASAQGVGWKNHEAQVVRFAKLYELIDGQDRLSFSINDLGCGVGDFVDFLSARARDFVYHGYDVMPEMIKKAMLNNGHHHHVSFQYISHAADMALSDYTIASGIFNIRFDTSDEDWLKHILETLGVMNSKSNRGFAFNVLSTYSDLAYRKKELYYADPGYLFDYCKKYFSKNVALLHDYDQYDFTLIVRK